MRLGIALIVGNGLAIDLIVRSGNTSLDSTRPFSLRFDVPFCSGMSWRDAFPQLAHRLDKVRSLQPEITDFDVFNALLTCPHPLILETRMREFLAFAYSALQAEMDLLDKDATPWSAWLRRHRSFLRAVVSFNYDLLLENLLRRAGTTPVPFGVQLTFGIEEDLRLMGIIQDPPDLPLLLKPHGSIDFAPHPRAISTPPRTYPSDDVVTLNDVPLVRVPQNRLGTPLQEAYIVLPTEYSPYLRFQWVRPGYEEFRKRANSITHCVFLGLSYWESDRGELNFLLDTLPRDTVVIEANPRPNPAFRAHVESLSLRYDQWTGDPLDITSGATR